MDTPKSIVNVSAACFDYVPVNSPGIWNMHGESILQHAFFRFQLQLVSMVTIAHIFHTFLKRFHFPRLTSDVLAGLIMGPTFFERYFPNKARLLFPPVPNLVFGSLLKIGYILFIFLAAVRLDTSWVKKIGQRGYILGALIFLFPYTMTESLQLVFDPNTTLTPVMIVVRENNAEMYLAAFTRSQFVDVSAVLMHLKITNSKLGHLALASTLLCDIGRFIFDNVTFLNMRVVHAATVRIGVQSFILITIYFAFILVLMRTLSFWFIRATPEGKQMNGLYVQIVVVVVLFLSSIGDTMGVNYLWGPFLFGLIIPAGSPLATNLTSKLDTFVYGLLVPLLSTHCASKVNIWELLGHMEDALNFQMALIGYTLQLIATLFMVLFCLHISFKEAVALSLILNIKGTKEMGTFLSFTPLEARDLDSTSGIFLIFLLTSYAPPLIKLLYDPTKHYIGYKKKCIQHTPYDAPLEILACAHKQEDATAAIKLLEFSSPAKRCSLTVYGLCLEELIGSDNPLLINHQLGQRNKDHVSRSQSIIDIFNYFKLQHKNLAQLNIFTAISPIKQIYQDICWLAFDKTCSLILVPHHKRWNNNGKLVSNNNDFRKLNINVLERAPCSVGILIDHRKTQGLSSIFESSETYNIAVLFIGGPDDREALSYALRMAKGNKVKVTIFCLVTTQGTVHDNWENMLDNECLRNIRHERSASMNINYVEKTVRDGSDTAAVINSIEGKYHLVMVGRRHETDPQAISGLSQWTELPELGPVGDLLASPDNTSSVLILVIQQQILKANHSDILNK
ncbi:cation/H(+) antiporter 15 isoform X1 [Jatropha curcas]|uniref:cation/H(+) antiporter 15 isoform X1 n=1 Tax=Jatropha curcas TaxID=180498 RepID=UPI001894F7A1|nr:cation/H(+) antiporter 15 isoform X1 [Jatropha curcas]